MGYTSEEIVEWLREMQDEYEGSGTVIDYAGHYKAAADRIGALEEWDRKRAQDIITLGFMFGTLEAALREIVEVEDEEGEYYLTSALAEVKTIARRALEAVKDPS